MSVSPWWEGVTVGADSRVVKIELREQKLTGVVPAALGGLTALKAGAYSRSFEIDLSACRGIGGAWRGCSGGDYEVSWGY